MTAMNIKHILVPTDFSPCSRHALDWAVSLAGRTEAHLRLLHILADYDPEWYSEADPEPQVTALRQEIEQDAEEELKAMMPDRAATGVESDIALERDLNVASAIVDHADACDTDLVVIGTHGRGGLSHVLLGSVAEQVVRRARRPVLTVGKDAPEPHKIERILAPIDFSRHSRKALRTAKELAALYDARLDLLFVAEERMVPVFSDTGIPSVNVLKMDPEIVKDSSEALAQLNEDVGGPEVEVQGHVAHGDVAPRITEFADTHDTDMIVIATRGLTGLDHFLIGSVTERVVRKAPCPVFTLHTEGDAEEEEA
mgnify:CR=1 FL=1